MFKKICCMLVISASFFSVAMAKALNTDEDRLAYSLGHMAGDHLKSQSKNGININSELFIQGVKDSMQDKSELTEEQIMKSLNYFKEKHPKLQGKIDSNLKIAKEFLEKNKQNPGVVELSNGLQYQIMEAGDQKASSPGQNDKVKVQYRGMLINGTEFDSSYGRGEAATFELKMLIKGWQEALVLMKPKAKWKLFVPPNLAYGADGAGALIEPNSALIFEIELLAVNP